MLGMCFNLGEGMPEGDLNGSFFLVHGLIRVEQRSFGERSLSSSGMDLTAWDVNIWILRDFKISCGALMLLGRYDWI